MTDLKHNSIRLHNHLHLIKATVSPLLYVIYEPVGKMEHEHQLRLKCSFPVPKYFQWYFA